MLVFASRISALLADFLLRQVVTSGNAWARIGGRLGFVQFPASENEPARSGLDVADRLQNVYKQYLIAFDSYYLAMMLERQRQLGLVQVNADSSGQVLPQ